jgi:type I site-specific restriction endonuclease
MQIKAKLENLNEADVRAAIIDPMLKELGFAEDTIVREKHFEKRSGSKKQKEALIPDYLLKVGDSYAWVLEAKASDKKLADYVQQAYNYFCISAFQR